MLKALLNFWIQEKTLLEETISNFEEMMNKAHGMYKSVTDALFLGGNLDTLKENIYKEDGQINKLEQTIRRQIVTSLSAGDRASGNITSSLILMSIVKDVERIGDYGKNIFEVFEKVSQLKPGTYHDRILKIRNEILGSFDVVKKAFRDSDKALAKELLESLNQSKKACDQIVSDLLDNEQTDHAVAYALLSRFFKRTLGHLSNIVTSVIMPVDKLDYFDKDHMEELERSLKGNTSS